MSIAAYVAWLSILLCPMFLIHSEKPGEFLGMDTPVLSSHLISGTTSVRQRRVLFLFIINFNDFMCMSCLDTFLSFCQSIPPRYLEENSWGILVLDSKADTHATEKTAQIAEKKLRGFIAANRIKFPIIIDYNRVFHSFAADGTALVIIDADGKRTVSYTFPLNRAAIQDVSEIILKE